MLAPLTGGIRSCHEMVLFLPSPLPASCGLPFRTLRHAAIGLDLLSKSVREQHEEMRERVFSVITDNCSQLHKDVVKRSEYLKNTGEAVIKEASPECCNGEQ